MSDEQRAVLIITEQGQVVAIKFTRSTDRGRDDEDRDKEDQEEQH